MSRIGEKILLFLSRKPGTPDYPGRTDRYNLSNALEFACETVPNFLDLIKGKTILDYGCGPGWQAVAMYKQGARQVIGVDIDERWLAHANRLASQEGASHSVRFYRELPKDLWGQFDVVISLSSFEHFSHPEEELATMHAAVAPAGKVIVAFAEPWFSHNGSHMGFFTRIPWVNVFFSEQTILRVRSRFRNDGAMRFEEVTGGLNRMTLAKFESIIRRSGMHLEFTKYYATRGLPLVHRLPVAREFLVSSVGCILRRANSTLRVPANAGETRTDEHINSTRLVSPVY